MHAMRPKCSVPCLFRLSFCSCCAVSFCTIAAKTNARNAGAWYQLSDDIRSASVYTHQSTANYTVSQKRIPGILATARARTVGFYNSGLTSASASLPGKFQDIPGPKAYSRTFQVLEILQTQFQDFPGGVGTLKLARSC